MVIPADLVLLAMGFVSPLQSMLDEFGAQKDARGNASAPTDGDGAYATGTQGVRRGRRAPRAVARRLGNPRGPAMRPLGRRVPHGIFRAAEIGLRRTLSPHKMP